MATYKDNSAETLMLAIEKAGFETQLNLENNYREEALKNFTDFKNLLEDALNKGVISQKKYDKKYKKTVEHFEKIFFPTDEEEVVRENPVIAFFKRIFNK